MGKIHEEALQMKRQGTWKGIANAAPFKSLPILEKSDFSYYFPFNVLSWNYSKDITKWDINWCPSPKACALLLVILWGIIDEVLIGWVWTLNWAWFCWSWPSSVCSPWSSSPWPPLMFILCPFSILQLHLILTKSFFFFFIFASMKWTFTLT